MTKGYKVRKFKNSERKTTGEPFLNYSLTVPREIAEKIPEHMRFECVWSPDGILFQPMKGSDTDTPQWVQNGTGAES